MSYSTWHFVTPSLFLGWLFRNMVLPTFVSMWQEIFQKTCVTWLLGNYSMDIVTRWVLHQYTTAYTSTSLVPISHTSTVPAAYEPVTFSNTLTRPTVVLSRPRSSSWPSRLSSCHGVLSPSFVPTFVVRWPQLLPPSCRRADDLFRPAAAAPSAPPSFLRGSATLRHFDTDQRERHFYTE